MAKLVAEDIAQTAERILEVDRLRAKDDSFLLTVMLHALVEDRLGIFRDAYMQQKSASGQRMGNSELANQSIGRLTERLREGYRFLSALPAFRVPSDKKLSAMHSYGWNGGKVGKLQSKDRVLSLAKLALSVTPTVLPADARYPADLLAEIEKELNILKDAEPGAQIGVRSSATKAKTKALKDLTLAVGRVRAFYISASDDMDKSPELAKIGLNPRQATGQRRIPAEMPPPTGDTVATTPGK